MTNVRLLIQVGVDPNSIFQQCGRNSQVPAVICATSYQQLEIVKLLLDAGAHVDLRAIDTNATALNEAARVENFGIVKMLVQHGADVNTIDTCTFVTSNGGIF